ncbi:MAG: ribonuclease HI family protein [Candidatus Omnitrophota bacterium]
MPKIKDNSRLCLFVDGASRGNPGPSAIGGVVFSDSGVKVAEISRYVGVTTNNVAEYLGVIYGLQEGFLLGAVSVLLKTDSQLVAKQLKGSYRVKDAKIRIFFDIASSLFRFFKNVEIEEIPREENSEADRLANSALDAKTLL